ncbi:MAG: MBL fold metallo-hydrolase [Nanoarchaeota archaeon]|nr:MBL fold metallo-hydrolase [Nanoarchaeota archaeon]
MDQIIFLGTGGSRYVMASQRRYTGGILIQHQENQLHIDPGPGALIRCHEFGIDPTKTTALLVSHKHIDHSNDINVLIDTITIGGKHKKGTLICSESLGYKSSILDVSRLNWLNRLIYLKPNEITRLGDITIEALPTKHSDETGIGFKIITNKTVLCYTSDTDYTAKIADSYLDADILILNCSLPELMPAKNHLCAGKTATILERVKPKLAILTHFGNDMLDANPLYQAREIQRKTGVQTIAAHDGLTINPISYSASSKQKRLNSFKK